MLSAFVDTHNMVSILTKSEASEGFNQIIDFLNGSYIKYALTVNPHIYVSCIKQFWNTVTVKQSNDITRLQALVNKKKVVLTEAAIRDVLHLDDAEGVDCLPNKEIFTELARMGAKRTSWNEFSSAMASAVICLSTGRKFNFSKYIFESLVRNVDSSSKFYMYPRFIQLIIQNQLGDLSTHTTKYTSPALTQKVFANIRRVRKGFSGVKTPLFKGMLVIGEHVEEGIADEQVQDDVVVAATQEALDACVVLSSRFEQLEFDKVSQALEITKLKKRVKRLEKGNKVKVFKLRRLKKVGKSQRIDSSDDTIMEDVSNQGRMIDELDRDEGDAFMGEQQEEKKTKEAKDIEDEPAEVEEVVEVVTIAKLITEVTAASTPVSAASITIPAVEPQVPAVTPTVVPVAAAYTRRRKGVVIRDPEEASTTIKPADTKSTDKGKGKLVEDPKPLKKKQQVELDEEFARKLHEELNKDIDWDTITGHVKLKAKED
nr:hypothetical protein [Tanacetum cinerariifolium]